MNILDMIPKPEDISPEESREKFAELEAMLAKFFDKIATTHQVQRSDLALHILSDLDNKGVQQLRYFVLHKNEYYWVNGKESEKVPLPTSFGKIMNHPIIALLEGQITKMGLSMLNDFAERNDLDSTKLCLHISGGNLSKYVLYEGKEYMKIDVENAINQFQQEKERIGEVKSLVEAQTG